MGARPFQRPLGPVGDEPQLDPPPPAWATLPDTIRAMFGGGMEA